MDNDQAKESVDKNSIVNQTNFKINDLKLNDFKIKLEKVTAETDQQQLTNVTNVTNVTNDNELNNSVIKLIDVSNQNLSVNLNDVSKEISNEVSNEVQNEFSNDLKNELSDEVLNENSNKDSDQDLIKDLDKELNEDSNKDLNEFKPETNQEQDNKNDNQEHDNKNDNQEHDNKDDNQEQDKNDNQDQDNKNDNQELNQIKTEQTDGQDEIDENKENCEDHVNFAIICSFFQQFGTQIGVNYSIETLKEMLEKSNKKLEDNLIELHVKLLRKIKKYVNREKWENGLVKFLYEFSNIYAYQLESTGYQQCDLKFKIDLLKCLLEAQFDFNQKFKSEINNIETLLLRLVPIGRDLNGNQYWYHLDEEHTLRIYREQPDTERSWKLICQSKDEFNQLIDDVENGKTEVCILNVSTSEENSDNEKEEEKKTKKSTKKGKKRGKKRKQKQLVNGHFKDENMNKNKETPDKKIKQETNEADKKIEDHSITPIKEEKRKRGRKPLNRTLFSKTDSKQPNQIDRFSSTDNIEQVVQETINSLLDQIDKNESLILESTLINVKEEPKILIDNSKISPNNNESQQSKQEEKVNSAKDNSSTKAKRGRKKKNPLGELSRLLGDNAPKNIEDLMPIKRSSRIQKLQEKKSAEMKIQMELEQKRLEEFNKAQEEARQKILFEQMDCTDSEHKTDESDDESFKEPVKSRKKFNDSSDTEHEFTAIKKKKRGRKSKKDKEREKLQKKFKKNCSDDELFYGSEADEEEETLIFEEKEDEFACEELEEDDEPVVLKRARTARKAKTEENNSEELDDEFVNDDTPCQKCNLYTNPEWILLCDNCNLGYHTDCLIPKLYLIPDGDWYCPKCENDQLLTKLKFEFENYVSNLAKREREQLRKERLKYVEINIGNILTEESTSRKNKSNKKKYGDYVSEIEDSDLDDEDDLNEDNTSDNDFDSENSETFNNRKKNPSNRKRNYSSSYNKRKAVQSQRQHKVNRSQRKRKISYSDETGSSSDLNSSLSSQDDQSSSSSLPRERTARKKANYQFTDYDELINKAIQASDYEENVYNEEDEDEEEDEENSDCGKPYSKGKDIANLLSMETENPFEDSKPSKDETVAVVDSENVEKTNEKEIEKDQEDNERKVLIPEKKKGRQKGKRKLNDLDSPIEEAENDSDFTIKDESLTELEEDTEEDEVVSDDYTNDSDDDTDLSDWARNTRKKASTRSGSRRNNKSKRNKKRRRYHSSDDESDYGYKTRRRSTRIVYKEPSTTEDEDDDYSDNSEKLSNKKKKDSNKKKKKESTDEFSDEQTDNEDERAVIKKSKRTQKKKIYDDYTDLDESEVEEQIEKETVNDTKDVTKVDQQVSDKNEQLNETDALITEQHQSPQVQVTEVQLSNQDEQPQLSNDVIITPQVKKTSKVKIKITKPNPNLPKNKNLSTVDVSSLNSQINLPNAQYTEISNSNLQASQLENTFQQTVPIEQSTGDTATKKRRGRAPKDPNSTPAKRGRKPKSLLGQESINNIITQDNQSSALSKLTQFTNDVKLGPTNDNFLPSTLNSSSLSNPLDAVNIKQLLNPTPNVQQFNDLANKNLPFPNQLLSHAHQSEIIARQAALINNDKKSLIESTKSVSRSKQSNSKTSSSTTAQSVPQHKPISLPVSTTTNTKTSTSHNIQQSVNLNHPTIPHYPQAIHNNSNPLAITTLASSSHTPRHPTQISNHFNPALLNAGLNSINSQQHPIQPNALTPNYSNHSQIPPHFLPNNPYYPSPHLPTTGHPHSVLSPQIASHLANQQQQFASQMARFGAPQFAGYSPFYPDPNSYPYSYGHNYPPPPMSNPYQQYNPNHHQSLPSGSLHPSQIPNIQPSQPPQISTTASVPTTHNVTLQSNSTKTTVKTTSSTATTQP